MEYSYQPLSVRIDKSELEIHCSLCFINWYLVIYLSIGLVSIKADTR